MSSSPSAPGNGGEKGDRNDSYRNADQPGPCADGICSQLGAAGGNLTGVTFLTDELSGKRLELLKESIPGISRAVVLWEPAHVDNEFKGMQAVAPGLGVRLQLVELPAYGPTG